MKKLLILLLLTFFAAATVSAADTKIGYVDLQKALNNCEAGKVAKEKISVKVKEYETQIEQKQKDLKKLKDDLDKQGLILSDDKRAAKKRDFDQKLKDLERFTKDIQEELQQQDAEYTRQIITDFSKIINDLGAKEGYTAIFEKTESALLYADQKADLTDKAIKAYDASLKK
ncbi:MAG: OmpH family outer membrane protein [Desulfuromonadales bacterium]|nr:OmpH family outer membrane protein [Desulfuromonadales bacterium]